MSISDIIAIRNLFPGQEPELSFFRPDEPPKARYRFVDRNDELAARSEATALIERLFEKHDEDEEAAGEEFKELLKADERLELAVIYTVVDQMIEDNPVWKKHFAKLERAKLKRAAK